MDDHLTSFLKVKRFAKVSTTLAGMAGRLVADRTTSYEIDNERYAQQLLEVLGTLKGPIMKVVQFLATIPNALPPEYAKAFSTLQAHAPAMGNYFVKRRLATELGANWKDNFSTFEDTPSFAASLGQVHKATLKDGTPVAIKLQYPNMEAIVESDLSQLKLVLKTYKLFNRALDLNQVFAEIEERLKEELDYTLEATRLAQYHTFYAQSCANTSNSSFQDKVKAPKAYTHLSTSKLLVMDWVNGKPLTQIAPELSQAEKDELGRQLFRAWYRPFYLKGWIHGDPHPGNYCVDDEGYLTILDFGCVRIFDNNFISGVIELYQALKTNDEALARQAYERWGFSNLSDEIMQAMTRWAKLLYDPLLEDCTRPIQRDQSGEIGWNTAVEVHRLLEANGGIKVPNAFVFMDRAAVGIGSVLMRVGSQCNWHRLFEEILQEMSATQI